MYDIIGCVLYDDESECVCKRCRSGKVFVDVFQIPRLYVNIQFTPVTMYCVI